MNAVQRKTCKMVSKTQYSSLYIYKVASIGFYLLLSLLLSLKVFFNKVVGIDGTLATSINQGGRGMPLCPPRFLRSCSLFRSIRWFMVRASWKDFMQLISCRHISGRKIYKEICANQCQMGRSLKLQSLKIDLLKYRLGLRFGANFTNKLYVIHK